MVAAAFIGNTSVSAQQDLCSDSGKSLESALDSYIDGDYARAQPILDCIVDRGRPEHRLFARFYLARIYADNNGNMTDHARAYALFTDIVNEYGRRMDPENRRLSPFVARAITEVGRYVLRGVPAAAVRPNSALASELFQLAASVFDEPNAQFELAKLLLVGDGVERDPKLSFHYLQSLSQRSHAGAQAFFADRLWRGQTVAGRDPVTALALARLAVNNAQPSDRIWIEDIYQNIYCGASTSIRSEASGQVASWSRAFLRPDGTGSIRAPTPDLQPERALRFTRTCADGEVVDLSPLVPTADQPMAGNFKGDVRPAGQQRSSDR